MKREYIPALIALTVLTFFGTTTAYSQPDSEEITLAESREVNRIARRFSTRMARTRNIEPLIAEFFVSDFIERSLKIQDGEWMLMAKTIVARRMNRRELKRFFVASNNFYYLSLLVNFSRVSAGNNDDDAAGKGDPILRKLFKLQKADPVLRIYVGDDSDLDDAFPIDSKRKFRDFLYAFERVEPALRRLSRTFNAGRTHQWYETIEYWKARFSYFEPSLQECDDDCFGEPKGTRVYVVAVPAFALFLIRDKGKMKIVFAIMHTD